MTQYHKELVELFISDNRNTKRKRINTLKAELNELDYRINHIQKGIESKERKSILGYYALLYGDRYYTKDLNEYKEQAKYIRSAWDLLISEGL